MGQAGAFIGSDGPPFGLGLLASEHFNREIMPREEYFSKGTVGLVAKVGRNL